MSDSKEIKLIAADVDGTLLNSKAEISARTEAALRKAVEQGVHVVLATGKTRNSTMRHIESLGLNAPGIYLQGLAIYDGDGKVRWQKTLDTALVRQVITYAEDRGFSVIAYSGMRIMVRRMSQQIEDGLIKYHEPLPDEVGPLQNVLNDIPVHKLILLGEPRAIAALRWQLNLQIGGAGRLMQAGLPWMLEVLPPGCSKGAALKLLLKEMQIAPENVLAIGDAENDIEMIQLAGIGVAMGHAAQNVKDAADHVTGSNDEEGAAAAIERYVLKIEAPAAEKPAETTTSAASEQTAPAPASVETPPEAKETTP
jgi:Cof subfamily protein (haloacid dehalogenase superfamily)